MKGRYILPAVFAALLLWAASQTISIRDLSRGVEEAQHNADALAAEQEEIRARIHERAAEAAAPEAPDPEPEPDPQPAEPVFHPLDVEMPEDLQAHAWRLCLEYGVPFEVVMAVAWHESRFTVDAVGVNTNGTQDSGIMQINDVNRGWLMDQYGLDVDDPRDNIEAGIVILSMFWHKYTPEQALTAYGWGETGMLRAGVASRSAERVLAKAAEYSEGKEVDADEYAA